MIVHGVMSAYNDDAVVNTFYNILRMPDDKAEDYTTTTTTTTKYDKVDGAQSK